MCILICMNTKQMPFVSEHIVLILRVHTLKLFADKEHNQKGKFVLVERGFHQFSQAKG